MGLASGWPWSSDWSSCTAGRLPPSSPGLGEGSTFTVRLPLVAADKAWQSRKRLKRPPRHSFQVSGRRVLVVDDNVDGAESLAKVLQFCGHDDPDRSQRPGGPGRGPPVSDRKWCFSTSGFRGCRVRGGEAVAWPSRRSSRPCWWPSPAGEARTNKRQSREAGFDFHLTKPVEVKAIEGILAQFATSRQKPGGSPGRASDTDCGNL